MVIRQAQAQDTTAASELIFSSAATLLARMFNVTADLNALGFLTNAFSQQDGQYGFANHWVIESDDQPVAIACGWHCELPEVFHRATIQSMTNYYGIEHTLEVVQRCQVLKSIFTAPQKDDWCIGHFAVSVQHQRQGLGTRLMTQMRELALEAGKKNLTLDVESANQAAQLFYQSLGFQMAKKQLAGQQISGSGIATYSHMVLPI
ncbi:MAG: GNAT superfamily N-acetyltransferase [Paraglaciecola sp.]|jgi:GNAT superfamily N-acetyltransferase